MASALGHIFRSVHRKDGEPLNILTFPTHERYETGLCKTNHQFLAVRAEGIKDWNKTYAPLPDNYVLLNPMRGDDQVPAEVDFDLVLSQNKFGQFERAKKVSIRLQLPLVSLEHTLPVPTWGKGRRQSLREMCGHFNVFISEFSRDAWGWSSADAEVIHHGIDTETFSPAPLTRKAHALSVVNDWRNRDWCCGYKLWEQATAGLPVRVVGDTPGLSVPASSVADLVHAYRESRIFVNTSLVSPVPTALLEAMSCGCACVSADTCMIPEIIKDGENGFLCKDAKAITEKMRLLLNDAELAERMGAAARTTVLERFGMDTFVSKWDAMFRKAAEFIYTGD